MENFDSLMHGFSIAISVPHIALMIGGVLLGILVGVLPGLGAPNGVSLLLPLTFGMAPVSAIILLSSIYWGALFGGSVTSILFNIPGDRSAGDGVRLGGVRRAGRRRADHLPRLVDRGRGVAVWAGGIFRGLFPGLLELHRRGWRAADEDRRVAGDRLRDRGDRHGHGFGQRAPHHGR